MKYVVLTLLGFSMLAGCSNEPSTDPTASAPMAAPSTEEPATAAASEASSLVMEAPRMTIYRMGFFFSCFLTMRESSPTFSDSGSSWKVGCLST